MEIKINWDYAKGVVETKDMKLSISEIHTGDIDSSNLLCEEIVRRFNEFPEELKR